MSLYCDYEQPQFYLSKYHTAKKQYNCEECSDVIKVGERYCKTVGKWDGDIITYRQHLECEEACRWIRDAVQHECILFGDLMNTLNEMKFNIKAMKKRRVEQQFRSIMAKVVWRSKKKRPLKFFKPLKVHNEWLARDREKGCGT